MAELTDDEIDAALARGRAFAASEPRAVSARYDAAAGRVVVDLANGCTFGFPARRVQGLETATDAEIAAVEVLPQGGGLHWERRDVDISLPGLMAGIFGTRAHMARLAGQATSPAKAAAARANGAKGRTAAQGGAAVAGRCSSASPSVAGGLSRGGAAG